MHEQIKNEAYILTKEDIEQLKNDIKKLHYEHVMQMAQFELLLKDFLSNIKYIMVAFIIAEIVISLMVRIITTCSM